MPSSLALSPDKRTSCSAARNSADSSGFAAFNANCASDSVRASAIRASAARSRRCAWDSCTVLAKKIVQVSERGKRQAHHHGFDQDVGGKKH